jgi:hypothetical protein
MPAGEHPVRSDDQRVRVVVEVQRPDSCSAGWSKAEDSQTVLGRVDNSGEDQAGSAVSRVPCSRDSVSMNRLRSHHMLTKSREHGTQIRPSLRKFSKYCPHALGPSEMLRPALASRVEQRDFRVGLRIDRMGSVGFMTVAERAAQPEVGFLVRSALDPSAPSTLKSRVRYCGPVERKPTAGPQ